MNPSPYPDRVVVTGIGLVTGLGASRDASWRALREGRSALRPLEIADGPPYAGAPAAIDHEGPAGLIRRASAEAIADAGLIGPSLDRERVAVVVGVSKGDLTGFARRSPSRPSDWVASWPDLAAALIASTFDLRGPSLAPVAACATGLVAALRGVELIRQGACDVAIVGSGDASLDPLMLGGFRRMGVLARFEGDPAKAVRPWDRDRSGFLVGEGAAILVLERERHARGRGALAYCELAGGATGADAYHMTDLNPDAANLAGLIGRALSASSVAREDIDHVNVHGTATRSNDPLECRALRLALGDQADRVACSANKAQVGHTLGAAGAVELAFTALAVRDGFVPPTLNLDHADPHCDLDGTPHLGRPWPIRSALKLSIGFGGHLAAALLRTYEP